MASPYATANPLLVTSAAGGSPYAQPAANSGSAYAQPAAGGAPNPALVSGGSTGGTSNPLLVSGGSGGGGSNPLLVSGAQPAAAPSHGGGGIGGFLHEVVHNPVTNEIGKTASGLVSDVVHAPGGLVKVAEVTAPLEEALVGGPLPSGKQLHAAGSLAKGMGEQTVKSLTDPSYIAAHPDQFILTALGVASGGAGLAARTAAAGKALAAADEAGVGSRVAAAGKALATKPAPVTRLISHDGYPVELPAATNPLTRAVQKGTDRLRMAFPDVPVFGAAAKVNRAIRTQTRIASRRAEAPIRLMTAKAANAGMLKRVKVGGPSSLFKYSPDALARQHAVRVVAEGAKTANRIQFHEGMLAKGYTAAARQHPEIAEMKAADFTRGHETQIALNTAARKYLDETGSKPVLNDPKMQAAYDQMLKVGGGREGVLEQLDKLAPENAAGRLNAPGRLFHGAQWVAETKSRLGEPTPALLRQRAQVDRLTKLYDRATARTRGAAEKLAGPEDVITPAGGVQAERLGAALSVAKERLASMEAAAAKRVKPTGLVGAEDFTGGEMRVPTVPAFKQPKSTRLPGNVGSSAGVGEGKEPGTLTHPYTGAAYRGGNVRTDVVKLMAESALEAQRFWTLLHVTDRLKQAAKDAPTSEHDVPIVTESLPGRPSLAEARARLESETPDPHALAALAHGYEGFRQAIFPTEEEAAGVPGVKWIDERLLGGLNKPNPLRSFTEHKGGQAFIGAIDTINSASKMAILYLKGAYLAPNLLSNLAMNLVQQGFAAPVNLARSAHLLHADGELAGEALASMGEGFGPGAFTEGTDRATRGARALANLWSKPVDHLPRLAAFLYEARRSGITTTDQLRQLFADPMQADKLDQITLRANHAMIDFGDLTPIERSVVSRVIFFYPWVKGSAAWLARFPVEHPIQAGALGVLGAAGQQAQQEALGPQIPGWAAPLIPVGGPGPHGLPQTFDPFTVTPFVQTGQLAQSVDSLLAGHPTQAANNVASMLTPAVAALITGLTHGPGAAARGLYANLPPVVAAEQAIGKGSKTYPYEGTPLEALLRFVAGTGFVPRETSPAALQRSAYLEAHPRKGG